MLAGDGDLETHLWSIVLSARQQAREHLLATLPACGKFDSDIHRLAVLSSAVLAMELATGDQKEIEARESSQHAARAR